MPRRSKVTFDEVTMWPNLIAATYRAAKGKRLQPVVRTFLDDVTSNLRRLQIAIIDDRLAIGEATTFKIFDPKPRVIHAPVFQERILHHALVNIVGPVLERSLVDDTFACRIGKGTLAAVERIQYQSRRHKWFGKLDVRNYFASIDHQILQNMLARKFKDGRLFHLMFQIIAAHQSQPGIGLPIGALTSQTFANFFLNPLDRFLLEETDARGIVRYMDDVVWWCDTNRQAVQVGQAAEEFLQSTLRLTIKPMQINRTIQGVSACGYRIFPGAIRLNKRRQMLYRRARTRWETAYEKGEISAYQLQAGYASALGMTVHADARSWRQNDLKRNPPLESCRDI